MDIESVNKAFVMIQSAVHTAARGLAQEHGTRSWQTLKELDESLVVISEALKLAFPEKQPEGKKQEEQK